MKPDARYAILACLALCVVAAVALPIAGPVVYTLEKDVFPSIFHANENVLKAQEINSTTDVLPLMQDLLDYTGPIVLNVRIKDIDQARRDLQLFAKNRKSFSNLVLKLDMTESEIEDFSRNSKNEEMILQDLINSSISLDQLTSLEIQYRDSSNPTMLASIRLQGETLRKKIRELSVKYKEASEKKTAVAKKIGLDVTKEEESVQEFERYVNEIDRQSQQNRQIDIPIRRSAQMSLFLSPDSGSYRDTITCFGYYFSLYGYRVSSTPGKEVTLYIDNRSAGTFITDDVGAYMFPYAIERITAGTHTIHTGSGTTLSEDRILTVEPVNSTTTLTVTPSKKAGEVTCTGSVVANLPVRNAPVELIRDGSVVSRTTTNANGAYKATLRLPEGAHTLQARFTGEEFPINPSESEVKTIAVGFSLVLVFVDAPVVLIGALICIFSLAAGGVLYYLQRLPWQRLRPAPAVTPPEVMDEPTPASAPESIILPSPPLPDESPALHETLFERYAGILRSAGLGEASHAAYGDLAGRIARDLKISRHRALTPREISKTCRERPYCGPFSRLVSAYERIRYGGQRVGPVREEFEASMQDTDSHLGGGDH